MTGHEWILDILTDLEVYAAKYGMTKLQGKMWEARSAAKVEMVNNDARDDALAQMPIPERVN